MKSSSPLANLGGWKGFAIAVALGFITVSILAWIIA